MNYYISVVLILVANSAGMGQSNFQAFEPAQPARATQIVAYRGMNMLAPESSLEAIMASATDFIEWVKVEIRLTKDGSHLIIHNDEVNGCSDGKGKVHDMMLEELKQLDSGSWFATRFKNTHFSTLPELLEAARGKVNLVLDCQRVDPDRLVKEIIAAKMERQVILRGQQEILATVLKSSESKISIVAKLQELERKQFTPAAVEIEAELVTAELCKDFHARGIKVLASVIGDKRDSQTSCVKMLEMGADWIQTEDPVGVRFAEVRRRIPKFPVKISYHRGALRYAPENTIPAIAKAATLGADYIEIDIRPTLDGKYMLLHDGTLDRTTNGKGPIRKSTFDEVAKLSAGRWFGQPFADLRVPTLSDGLIAMGKQSHGYLDAKDITPEDLIEAMRKHDLVERSVVYQSVRYLEKLKALEPKVRPLPPLGRPDQFERVAAIGPYGFDANWSILSRELIEKSHKAGIKVFSDSMSNEHEKVEQYLKAMDWGIDVIQTNHPLRVLRAIELFESQRR